MSRSAAQLAIVQATLRRYEHEQDEPWKTRALSLVKGLLKVAERGERASGCDLAPLLDAAARLPSDADCIRDALWGWVLAATDEGHIGAIQQRPIGPGVLVITSYGGLAIVSEREASSRSA